MLKVGIVKEIYEMKGSGYSIRDIAGELDIARNTVRRYLKDPEAVMPKRRRRRSSKLDPYIEHVDRRLSEGLENCVVPKVWGTRGATPSYVSPRRRRPGSAVPELWGFLRKGAEAANSFVMVLGWSRAIYVELVRRADTASFIQCHVNAFDYLGGVPRRCLYDNAKVVTLGRDAEGRTEWNRRMWTSPFFDPCQPYRAQTKGKVESGVKYVRGNLWPSLRFTDDSNSCP